MHLCFPKIKQTKQKKTSPPILQLPLLFRADFKFLNKYMINEHYSFGWRCSHTQRLTDIHGPNKYFDSSFWQLASWCDSAWQMCANTVCWQANMNWTVKQQNQQMNERLNDTKHDKTKHNTTSQQRRGSKAGLHLNDTHFCFAFDAVVGL